MAIKPTDIVVKQQTFNYSTQTQSPVTSSNGGASIGALLSNSSQTQSI